MGSRGAISCSLPRSIRFFTASDSGERRANPPVEIRMPTISAVFQSGSAARGAIDSLAGIGVEEEKINSLTPGNAPGEANAAAGLAKSTGATLGGILGMGASTFLIPGLGPIAGFGLIAGAVAGTALGAMAGRAVDRKTDVPREDLYFFEDVLR